MAKNTIFEKMIDDALEDLANLGSRAPDRAVILAGFGMVMRNLSEKIDSLRRPIYFVAGAILTVGIAWMAEIILSRVF